MKFASILLFLLFSLVNACAYDLTEMDKKVVLKSLDLMEADPFSKDSNEMIVYAADLIDKAENLVVHVDVSPLITPLLNTKYKYREELFLQFVVSNAAYAIQHEGAIDNTYKRNLYSIKRSIKVYNRIKKKDNEPFPHFDSYSSLSDQKLAAVVRLHCKAEQGVGENGPKSDSDSTTR